MKKRNVLGISFFSAILLGSVSYTQVKAEDIQAIDNTDKTSVVTNNSSSLQSSNVTTAPPDNQVNDVNTNNNNQVDSTNNPDEKSTQENVVPDEKTDTTQVKGTANASIIPSEPSTPEVTTPASDEQQVNVYIKNQHNEIVKDVYGNNVIAYTGTAKVGDVLNNSNFTLPKSQMSMYFFTPNQSITVQDGVNDYYINATGRRALLHFGRYVNGKWGFSFPVTWSNVLYHNTRDQSQWEPVYAGDTFNISDVALPESPLSDADGYKPKKITIKQLDDEGREYEVPINSDNGDITINSRIDGTNSFYHTDFDFGFMLYFEEPIPIYYQDSMGNTIAVSNQDDQVILDAKNNNGDVDAPDYAKYAKKIDGYTFQSGLSSYVMEWDPDGSLNLDTSKLVIGYSKDDETYPIVNYRDIDGNVIYRDTNYNLNLQPSDIPDISTLDNGKFTDLQNDVVKKTDTGYDITVKDQGLSFRVIQKIGNLIISNDYTDLTLKNGIKKINFTGNLGNYKLNMDTSTYKYDSFSYDDSDTELSFTKAGLSSNGLTDMQSLIDYLNASITDDFITTGLRDKYILTGVYDAQPSQVTINYLDENGNTISTTTKGYPTEDNTTVNQIIELPKGYKISDIPIVVNSASDAEKLVLNVTIDKDSNNNTHSGGGSSSSNHNSNDTSDIVKINQKLSVKNKNVTIVNSAGKSLPRVLSEYSNWKTDERMNIDGETYYRVGSDEWINEKDIYLYTDNMSKVYTYSDSYKLLMDYNGKIANRALQASTDWITDRYAYFDGQKYYRVATNEWVKDSDVVEYHPITTIINTLGTTIYDERGNNMGTLSAGNYKADRFAIINNIKMYRVATNEWIKAN